MLKIFYLNNFSVFLCVSIAFHIIVLFLPLYSNKIEIKTEPDKILTLEFQNIKQTDLVNATEIKNNKNIVPEKESVQEIIKNEIIENMPEEILEIEEIPEIIKQEEIIEKKEELIKPEPEKIIEKETPQDLPKEEIEVEKNSVIADKIVENIPVKPLEEYKQIQNTNIQPQRITPTVTNNKPATNIMPLQNKTDIVSNIPTQPAFDINQITAAYTNTIRKKIEKIKKYPKWALQEGFEGTVYVSFILWRNGSVSEIKLVRSSGYKILDTEALSSVKRAAPFPAIPFQLSSNSISLEIGIVFKLL